MIDAQRSEPQRQFQAADRMKLLCVHLDPEAVLKRTCEHRLSLRGIPRFFLDKNIPGLRKAATGRFWNQLTSYLIQIGILARVPQLVEYESAASAQSVWEAVKPAFVPLPACEARLEC